MVIIKMIVIILILVNHIKTTLITRDISLSSDSSMGKKFNQVYEYDKE